MALVTWLEKRCCDQHNLARSAFINMFLWPDSFHHVVRGEGLVGDGSASDHIRCVRCVIRAVAGENEQQRSESAHALDIANGGRLAWLRGPRRLTVVATSCIFTCLYEPVSRLCCEPLPRFNLSRTKKLRFGSDSVRRHFWSASGADAGQGMGP